jgi:hypothetical protein
VKFHSKGDSKLKNAVVSVVLSFGLVFSAASFAPAQEAQTEKTKSEKEKSKKDDSKGSIGGKEHDAEILGVKIGMDVPTALQAVFINANRKPGQEKPDAKRSEGKDNKDIRVVYKNLPQGELQIVFAEGKIVREVVLLYEKPPHIDDLRLPFTNDIGDNLVINANKPEITPTADIVANTTRGRGEAFDGSRFDDRYSVGFTDSQKVQRIWWRDEKTPDGYRVRVQFFSSNQVKNAGAKFVVTAVQKLLAVTPEDRFKFAQAHSVASN